MLGSRAKWEEERDRGKKGGQRICSLSSTAEPFLLAKYLLSVSSRPKPQVDSFPPSLSPLPFSLPLSSLSV